jgi:hypothetical protein
MLSRRNVYSFETHEFFSTFYWSLSLNFSFLCWSMVIIVCLCFFLSLSFFLSIKMEYQSAARIVWLIRWLISVFRWQWISILVNLWVFFLAKNRWINFGLKLLFKHMQVVIQVWALVRVWSLGDVLGNS